MFLSTQDEVYLDQARRAGERLAKTHVDGEAAGTVYWPRRTDEQYGLAHGASGPALFLLYLSLVTGESRFLDIGRAALEFDVVGSFRTRDGGRGLSRYRGQHYVKYPYWRYGSAGLGCVLVRYLAVLGEPAHRELLDGIAVDAHAKYASFCGYFLGLAGILQFFRDAHRLLRDPRYEATVQDIAAGVGLFQVRRAGGVAFPGDGGLKISCDFATGGAGVAVVLDGVLRPEQRAPFMLDEVLRNRATGWAPAVESCDSGV